MKNQKGFMAGELAVIIFIVVCFAAWATHVYVCLVNESWGFLLAGALMFPVAIFHGVGIWLGVV